MSSVSFLLLLLVLLPGVWTYEAREDKQDVFARRACPAFLTFSNAAYVAGVTVELPCHCKPQQIQSVVWFFRKHSDGAEDTRVLTDLHGNKLLDTSQVPHSGDLRSRFSIRLFSLLIFRAGPDDSGIYICGSTNRDFFFGYDLDLQEAAMVKFSPRSISSRTSMRAAEQLGAPPLTYRVFTGFQPWSTCDRCGVQGEQVRVGLCYIHSHFLHVRYRRANQTVASCGSGAVPGAFDQLRKTGAKLQVRSCQVTCSSRDPPSSTLLALLAFLGYSSGSVAEAIRVFYLSHPADSVLTLGCPGARPNMAVAWDRESEPIYRYGNSSAATNRRLFIDIGNHLVFQQAKIEDSGRYYCWLQGRRVAEIRLLVHPHFGRRQSAFSNPELPAAIWNLLKCYAAMAAAFCLLLAARIVLRLRRDRQMWIKSL